MFWISPKKVHMKYLSLLLCLCTYSLLQKKQINLKHQPSPVGSSCKGQECGKCFLFQSLAVCFFFFFLNLKYFGLREQKIYLNLPEKQTRADGEGGWVSIKGGNRKWLEKTRARKDTPSVISTYLTSGHLVQKAKINKPRVFTHILTKGRTTQHGSGHPVHTH